MAVEDAIQRYKRNREVLYAEPNYIVHIDNTPNDPSFPDLWGLNNTGQGGGTVDADIDAPEAWDLTTGSSSVVIADIDTGIDYNHEDLAANVWQNPGDCSINGIDMEPRQPQVAAARREDRRAVARLRESQPDVDLVGLTPNGFELGMPQLQSEPRPLLAGYSP
jgi:subtilisin family serine protease